MAVSTANFGKLSPEIQLIQAISEYEAILSTDDKASLQHLKDKRPPDAIDVMRFTAVIDRTSQAGGRCVGTRFTNVLQAIQAFATVGDVVVGGSQNMMASGLWALVRFTLQIATNYVSFLEKVSNLFMEIGRSAPRYQNLGLVYPQSSSLQRTTCEYFTVLVQMCTKIVQFSQRKGLSRVLVTTLRPFDSEFGDFLQKLKSLGDAIKEDVLLLSAKSQQDEIRENSVFRSLIMRRVGSNSDKRRKPAAKLSLLDKCSVYDYGSSWRRMKKKGNSSWVCDSSEYVTWRDNNANENLPLVCFGKLGSGKTVLAANIAEDLIVHSPKGTVAYFFCRYDDALSLKARTILGSLIRQLAEFVGMDSLLDSDTKWPYMDVKPTGLFSLDELVVLFHEVIFEELKTKKVLLVIDGLDDCEETEKKVTIQYLRDLAAKGTVRLFFTTRSELEPTAVLINNYFNRYSKLQISRQTEEINDYINSELFRRLESGNLCLSNPEIIVEIQNALKANAQGMFLWVVLQIDSICDEETDDAILTALKDLPPDLPAVYDRILEKNSRSPYRKKILQIISSAYRPLTLWELREALSVTPGDDNMDRTKFVNDIYKTISCCESLIELNEEQQTVHFVHPSTKQHFLVSDAESTSSNTSHRFSINEANKLVGGIRVTYLNWSIFESRITAQPKPWKMSGSEAVSAAFTLPFQSSNVAKKVAQMYLEKTRRLSSPSGSSSSFDFRRALVEMHSRTNNQQSPEKFFFLEYVKKYWLNHSKEFDESMGPAWTLWQKLINDPPPIIGRLPWDKNSDGDMSATLGDDLPSERTKWVFENQHQALIPIVLKTDRAGFLKLADDAEQVALTHEMMGSWNQAAAIRENIVECLKPAYFTAPLDLFRAMWDLSLSYEAVGGKQDMLNALLTDLLLKFKEQNRPLVYNILDFSAAFEMARANARFAKIAKQLLDRALSLSRTLLGEADGNTKQLLHDFEKLDESSLMDEEFGQRRYSTPKSFRRRSLF